MIMSSTTVFTQIYWMAIYTLVIFGVNELTTNSKKGTVLIALFPLLIYPLLMQTTFNGWFNFIKFFTLVFAFFYATFLRFVIHKRWALNLLALLLHINICEAMLRDFSSGNYLNLASGIIVLLLLYWPTKLAISAPEGNRPAQITYPVSWAAIIAYCAWHMCFIYGYKSGRGVQGDYVLLNVVMLAVPCLVAYFRSTSDFFQSRLYTLSFVVVLIEATMTRNRNIWPLSPGIYSPSGYLAVSISTLLVCCICLGYMIFNKPKELTDTPLGLLFK